jgi:hypothetical protein
LPFPRFPPSTTTAAGLTTNAPAEAFAAAALPAVPGLPPATTSSSTDGSSSIPDPAPTSAVAPAPAPLPRPPRPTTTRRKEVHAPSSFSAISLAGTLATRRVNSVSSARASRKERGIVSLVSPANVFAGLRTISAVVAATWPSITSSSSSRASNLAPKRSSAGAVVAPADIGDVQNM